MSNNFRSAATYYGVQESNSIADAAYNHTVVDHSVTVYLDDPRIVSIDRIRFISSPGFPMWDFSYAYCTIMEQNEAGQDCLKHVRLDIDAFQIPKRVFWTKLKEIPAQFGMSLKQCRDLGMFSDNVVSLCH